MIRQALQDLYCGRRVLIRVHHFEPACRCGHALIRFVPLSLLKVNVCD